MSMLVTHECRNISNEIEDSAHMFPSNQTAHGWRSITPALRHYRQRLQNDTNGSFKSNNMFSDRGRGDIWCATFIAHACELAEEFGNTIQPNTSAANEGK